MEELFGAPAPEKHSVWDEYVPIVQEGNHSDIYLSDAIDAPSEYNKVCHLLNASKKGDTVTLHTNNGGGYVDSGFMIIDAIKYSKATITAKLTGTVASISTIIALSCHKIIAADYVQFMIHNYSGGAQGKGHEMKAQLDFSNNELNKAFSEIYSGFLTPHEMELVIAGKDIWMGRDELIARLKARKNGNKKALKKIEASRKDT